MFVAVVIISFLVLVIPLLLEEILFSCSLTFFLPTVFVFVFVISFFLEEILFSSSVTFFLPTVFSARGRGCGRGALWEDEAAREQTGGGLQFSVHPAWTSD